ncbi:MAG TPA: sugar ABC transporter permease [Herpetosiphonaceae bacterium]
MLDPMWFTLKWVAGTIILILVSSVALGQAASWLTRLSGKSRMVQERAFAGYAFAAPWIVGFLLFVVGPAALSFYWSFTRYALPAPPAWIGLENYTRLLTDSAFHVSLLNSLYMTIFGVPTQLAVGLALALLLNQKLRGVKLFRMVFYLPVILAGNAAMLLTWRLMLNPNNGVINTILGFLSNVVLPFNWLLRAVIYVTELSNAAFMGLQRGNFAALGNVINGGFPGAERLPLWHQSPLWSKPALVLILAWSAGMMMVIYLAALNGVPRQLYEAAEVDGATRWQRFRHITLPLITPATFYNLVVGMIATLQIFEQSYILTRDGGPAQSTYFAAYYLWRATFRFNEVGYGAAMSWVLLVIILVCTAIQFRIANRWVYYEAQ